MISRYSLGRRARHARLLLASASLLAALAVACGGGDGEPPATVSPAAAVATSAAAATSATATAATVGPAEIAAPTKQPSAAMTARSDDGTLVVDVPEGAAAAGVLVTITRIAGGALPAELQGVDAVVIAYELGPDDAQFSEPVTLTFRVDPADHGVDLPVGAVPPGLLLTENSDGELERIAGAELNNEDGQLVVRAMVTHLSPAIFVFDNGVALLLVPPRIELAEGGSIDVEVIARDLGTRERISVGDVLTSGRSVWRTTHPFTASFFRIGAVQKAKITCTTPTDGWVLGAYRVVLPSYNEAERPRMALIFGDFAETLGITLAGDGKCDAPAETGGGADGAPAAARAHGGAAGGGAAAGGASAGRGAAGVRSRLRV